MLHQTLISPFFSFHLSSSPSSSPHTSLPYSHSSRVEKETSMDLEMICSGSQLLDEEPWNVEKGNHVFGEEFVDEFLDLGGLTETEKELDDDDDKKKETNSFSSVVSFEPPPPVSELALPAHDVAELEWVSRLMDDSQLEFPPPCSAAAAVAVPPKDSKLAEEISSSVVLIVPSVKAKAKRSKRTRSPSGSWSNWGPADYSTSSSTTTTSSSSSSSSSYSTSSPLIFFTPIADMSPVKKQKIPKKRGRKPKPRPPLVPSISAAAGAAGTEIVYYQQQKHTNSTAGVERRCSHCGVNKTPQWRAGPMGAKTLCNACGVRYKSGRLLPEYRPACSPTFVSHVHSNSHRKVLEMRRKKETTETPKDDPSAAADVDSQNNNQSLYLVCSAPAVPSF